MNALASQVTSLDSIANPGFYTETERTYAIAVYAETGSTRAASAKTGIPHSTIAHWVNSEEGEALIQQLRTAIRSNVAWKYVEGVTKAMDRVLERLDKGDPFHYGDEGDIGYMPIKAWDAMRIAATAQDKLASLMGQLGNAKASGSALERLAEALLTKMEAVAPKAPEPLPQAPDAEDYLG